MMFGRNDATIKTAGNARKAENMTVPNNIHEQRLRELVTFPREDLNIELKRWLSPNDDADRANIAKALLALANSGGGYLLIGFDE